MLSGIERRGDTTIAGLPRREGEIYEIRFADPPSSLSFGNSEGPTINRGSLIWAGSISTIEFCTFAKC